MNLPLELDFAAMEAEPAKEIPRGPQWQYEPKWDGFRCLAFRDRDQVEIVSKSGQMLRRYFPEVTTALLTLKAPRFILDGELVELQKGQSDFDTLLQRIHPAESRIRKLAQESPVTFVLFDMLVDEHGRDLTPLPLSERRSHLIDFAGRELAQNERIMLSPSTLDFSVAQRWFEEMTGTLDGIVAKRIDLPYSAGTRNAMLKIKNIRSADCVVGGFRYGANERLVASLLLGLYDEDGLLHHCGYTSAIARSGKSELTSKLEKLIGPPGFTGAAPGGPSRWSNKRSTEWEPLQPKLVVEIHFDHFSGHRFRHGTKLMRWRHDKAPEQCTFAQVRLENKSATSLLD